MSGVTFTLPFYLQVLRGYSTLEAGLCFLPFAVAQLLAAPRSARMVARFGERLVIATGLTIVLGALVALTQLHLGTPLWKVLVVFFVFGFGMGNVIAPASTVMQNALPLARAGAGSAVQNTVRQVAGALGVAIVGTVLITRYGSALAPSLATLPPAFPQAGKDALMSSVAAVPVVAARASTAGLPARMVGALRADAFDAYLSASRVATVISCAVVLAADAAIITLLPRRIGHH
jgi:DHA2 family multidrug resistance protein-like MFS transporter